jgi:C2H2-type zinc finger/Zinc finger, C2H2 type
MHINRCHRPPQHKCPHCSDNFSIPKDLQRHVRVVHEKTRLPCPFADETGCTDTFMDKNSARTFAKAQHMNVRYPCPLAEEYDCKSVFCNQKSAKRHAISIHHQVRYICPFVGCGTTFSYQSSLDVHIINDTKTYDSHANLLKNMTVRRYLQADSTHISIQKYT